MVSVNGKLSWGGRHQYDLMIDSSCGIEKSAGIILQYVKAHEKMLKFDAL